MDEGPARKVLVLGATGTIGRATVRALLEAGHWPVCFARPRKNGMPHGFPGDAEVRYGDVGEPRSLARDGLRGERFDAMLTCLASRTGAAADAWAIDYRAQSQALRVAQAADIPQVVLLSAICVQKPVLAFQKAKLAFEAELVGSGLRYCIVRPTAFFKSLSGQIARLRQGKPYLMFGDGRLTACKPISDDDLARYLVGCLDAPERQNRILPIGGPGPAITPLEQGNRLFDLLGQAPRFRRVPVALLRGIAAGLGLAGRVSPRLAAKADLARIGHYYATESMLVWDEKAGRYDADATPSTGTETLFDYYARAIAGDAEVERGDHAVF